MESYAPGKTVLLINRNENMNNIYTVLHRLGFSPSIRKEGRNGSSWPDCFGWPNFSVHIKDLETGLPRMWLFNISVAMLSWVAFKFVSLQTNMAYSPCGTPRGWYTRRCRLLWTYSHAWIRVPPSATLDINTHRHTITQTACVIST